MALVLSCLSLIILFLFLTCLFLFFANRGYALPEAGVYAIVVSMAIYSTVFQLLFILHLYRFSFCVDAIIFILSVHEIIKYRDRLGEHIVQTIDFFVRYKKILVPFSMVFGYLFLQALLVPPSEYDSLIHNLPRILLMMQEGSLFLQNYTHLNQVGFFVGADILQFLFLRWYSDWFLGIFSFLSYIAVLLATFSLVRTHLGEEKLALVTALVMGSLTGLVLQSTSTKNDIPLTALTTAAFLAATHVLSRRDSLSLALLGTALALGSSMKAYFLGFSLPFGLLFLLVYFQELRAIPISSLKQSWGYFLLPVLLVFQLGMFMAVNQRAHGSFFGPPANVQIHKNLDGWRGALMNASRYLLQASGIPRQLGGGRLEARLAAWASPSKDAGKAPPEFHQMGPQDQDLSLSLFQPPVESLSWYGLLGFLLSFPALGYALIQGTTFIRVAAASLLAFFVAVCWNIGWLPWNGRYLSLFFGGSGLCVGYFLQQVLKRKYDAVLLVISFLFLCYAAFMNYFKPFMDMRQAGLWVHQHVVHVKEMEGKGEGDRRYYRYPVFTWVNFVVNRDSYWWRYYRDERITFFIQTVKPNSRLLWVGHKFSWTFPYLLKRPDVSITVTNPERLNNLGLGFLWQPGKPSLLAEHFDYVLVANVPPPPFLDPERLIFQGEGWVDERGDPQGESIRLYDYSASAKASHP